jgi:hypothetical protein
VTHVRRNLWPHLVPPALGLLVLAPVLGRGFVLTYDMVFVPHAPLDRRLLGLGGEVPRAVPSDGVVALLSRLVPADVLQKLVLLGILVGAGAGVLRLLRGMEPFARAAGAALYLWNPYVAERLVLGHWVTLVAYAVLPWAVNAVISISEDGGLHATATAVILVAAAALGASGGLVVVGTMLLVLAALRPARRALVGLLGGGMLVVNLPWLLPGVLASTLSTASSSVAAFAARPDTPLGTVPSVLTLGGVWNAEAVPPGRDTLVAALASLVVLVVAVLGLVHGVRRGAGRMQPAVVKALSVAAVVAVLIALAGALPGTRAVLRWAVSSLPGAGILRDGTRYLLPLALVEAVGFAVGIGRAVEVARGSARRMLPILGVIAPLAALPALGMGVAGRLAAVDYPDSWGTVTAIVAHDRTPGRVLCLPWALYRKFPWNGDRTVLDPATKALGRTVVVNDALLVGSIVVPNEDPVAARLTPVIDGGQAVVPALRAAGVRFVLVERRSGGFPFDERRLIGAVLVHADRQLALYRIERPAAIGPGPHTDGLVLVGDVLAVLTVGLAATVTVGPAVARIARTAIGRALG